MKHYVVEIYVTIVVYRVKSWETYRCKGSYDCGEEKKKDQVLHVVGNLRIEALKKGKDYENGFYVSKKQIRPTPHFYITTDEGNVKTLMKDVQQTVRD